MSKAVIIPLFFSLFVFSCAVKQGEQTKTDAWQYFYDMGMSSFVAKNYSEAIANFFRATQIAPNEPKVWNMLGVAYMEVQEYEKAESAFKKALDVDKGYTEAKLNMGILRYRQGRYEEAIKTFQEVLQDEAFPQKHIAFYNLARSYLAIGKEEDYLRNLKKAVAYNPLFVDAQLELANYYESKGQYEESKKVYQSLLVSGISGPNIDLGMARTEFGLKNYPSAKEYIKKILESRQTTPDIKRQAYELLTKVLVEEQQSLLDFIPEQKPSVDKQETPKTREVPAQRPNEQERAQNIVSILEQKPSADKQETPKVQEGSTQRPNEQERPQNKGVYYRIQLGAFSSEASAQKLKERLEGQLGLKGVKIFESSGIYRVLYGEFENINDAVKERIRLSSLNIYGIIVQY